MTKDQSLDCDHCIFISSLSIPPGVVDNNNNNSDTETEVLTIYASVMKLHDGGTIYNFSSLLLLCVSIPVAVAVVTCLRHRLRTNGFAAAVSQLCVKKKLTATQSSGINLLLLIILNKM